MTRSHITITIVDDGGSYRATEPGSDPTGRGDTVHDAIIDYVELAREASVEAADG